MLSGGVIFVLLTWLSAVVTGGVIIWAQHVGGPFGDYLIDKGAPRIMRRALLAGVIIILVLVLKKFDWRGWRDCGWTSDQPGQPPSSRWADFLFGTVIGFLTLGTLAATTIHGGVHQLKPFAGDSFNLIGIITLAAVSGLTVALVEETICRGILFRIISRPWGVWTAALATSIPFAIAHFIGQNNAAFQGNSFVAITVNATTATLLSIFPPAQDLVQFINLALLGITLCIFVMRTGTIWMAVGAHAAWVMIIKLHAVLTNFNPAAAASAWLGKRNDFMDSFSATLVFAIIIAASFLFRKAPGKRTQIKGQTWHLLPSETDRLANFMKNGESLFNDGFVLKSYNGCRVVSRDELVFKKYWPKTPSDKLSFAFRPLRGRRAFLLARQLIELGFPTPPVLAWSAARRCGLLQSESALVMEIKDAEQLTAWLERADKTSPLRLKVMEAYGNLAGYFHQNGYSNRDLKHENVMCSREKPWRLWVVDLDGVRKKLFITRSRAGRDLMRVGKSLASLGWTNEAEISAFFQAYNLHVPRRLRRRAFPD